MLDLASGYHWFPPRYPISTWYSLPWVGTGRYQLLAHSAHSCSWQGCARGPVKPVPVTSYNRSDSTCPPAWRAASLYSWVRSQ